MWLGPSSLLRMGGCLGWEQEGFKIHATLIAQLLDR